MQFYINRCVMLNKKRKCDWWIDYEDDDFIGEE